MEERITTLLRSLLEAQCDFALSDIPNDSMRKAMLNPHIHARWELRCDRDGIVRLTPPGVLHSSASHPQWSVEFDLRRILCRIHGRAFYRTYEIPEELIARHTAPQLCAMIAEVYPEQPLSRLLFQGMIASLDSMIGRLGALPDVPVSGEPAERVFSYLHTHYDQRDLSLDKLSEIFGLSPQHLNQCFRETFGVTMHALLSEIRLIHAHRLLAGGFSVRDAARMTGWGSPFYFCGRFRRRFGIVPSRVPRGAPSPELPNERRNGIRFTS